MRQFQEISLFFQEISLFFCAFWFFFGFVSLFCPKPGPPLVPLLSQPAFFAIHPRSPAPFPDPRNRFPSKKFRYYHFIEPIRKFSNKDKLLYYFYDWIFFLSLFFLFLSHFFFQIRIAPGRYHMIISFCDFLRFYLDPYSPSPHFFFYSPQEIGRIFHHLAIFRIRIQK